jgi:hypothetical protein
LAFLSGGARGLTRQRVRGRLTIVLCEDLLHKAHFGLALSGNLEPSIQRFFCALELLTQVSHLRERRQNRLTCSTFFRSSSSDLTTASSPPGIDATCAPRSKSRSLHQG